MGLPEWRSRKYLIKNPSRTTTGYLLVSSCRSSLFFQKSQEDQIKQVWSDSNIRTTEPEIKVKVLEKLFWIASKVSCSAKHNKRTSPLWWNELLSNIRKPTKKVFNNCYRDEYCRLYKASLKRYKPPINILKKWSWLDYCEVNENISDPEAADADKFPLSATRTVSQNLTWRLCNRSCLRMSNRHYRE